MLGGLWGGFAVFCWVWLAAGGRDPGFLALARLLAAVGATALAVGHLAFAVLLRRRRAGADPDG